MNLNLTLLDVKLVQHFFRTRKYLLINLIGQIFVIPENTVIEAVFGGVSGVTARVTVTRVKTSSSVTRGNARRTSSSVTCLECVLTHL